jgi:chemotaxis-related protein WspB
MFVLTFQVGGDRLALDVQRVREVIPRVNLQRVAGAPGWLAGLFVYRGQVVPVIDLHRLLGAGECPPHLSSRIILVVASALAEGGGKESLLGLLAAQVAEVRDIKTPQGVSGGTLGRPVVEGGTILHLVDLERLLPGTLPALLAASPAPEVQS